MSYKIYYGRCDRKRHSSRSVRRLLLTTAFFVLFLLTAHCLLPEQLCDLRNVLLSYDKVDSLVTELKQGQNVVEAIAAFCEDVFHGTKSYID